MKQRRSTKISAETERVLIISQRSCTIEGFCERCRKPVAMIGVKEAALVSGLSQRALFRRVEAEQLHYIETPDGSLLICLDSLLGETRVGREGITRTI